MLLGDRVHRIWFRKEKQSIHLKNKEKLEKN